VAETAGEGMKFPYTNYTTRRPYPHSESTSKNSHCQQTLTVTFAQPLVT